jgi:hypothetical protein
MDSIGTLRESVLQPPASVRGDANREVRTVDSIALPAQYIILVSAPVIRIVVSIVVEGKPVRKSFQK